MRSVDGWMRPGLAALLCASVAGCAAPALPWLSATAPPVEAAADVAPARAAAASPTAAAGGSAQAAAAPPATESPTAEAPVPPAAQRAFDEARRALAAGRVDDAERMLRALTQSHPELGGPHAALGLIHRQAGRHDQAVAALEQAVKASPQQVHYLNQLGIAYRHQGQFEKARKAYEQAIGIDASYAAPYLNLGILHDLYLWDGKRALELYDRYLALSASADPTVTKWVADLKNRKPQHASLARQEKE